MIPAIKRPYSSTIVPKPEPLENSEFPVDKFALSDHLHHGPERYKLVSEGIKALLAQQACMLLEIGMIVLQGIGEILHGIGWAIGIVLIQQPAYPVIMEKAGCDDLRDMLLFHPFQPAFMDQWRYLGGYIIYKHAYGFN